MGAGSLVSPYHFQEKYGGWEPGLTLPLSGGGWELGLGAPYHFQQVADVCIVVDHFCQHADELDDALGGLVAGGALPRQDAHAGHHALALLGLICCEEGTRGASPRARGN